MNKRGEETDIGHSNKVVDTVLVVAVVVVANASKGTSTVGITCFLALFPNFELHAELRSCPVQTEPLDEKPQSGSCCLCCTIQYDVSQSFEQVIKTSQDLLKDFIVLFPFHTIHSHPQVS